jgi:hypothetical protein
MVQVRNTEGVQGFDRNGNPKVNGRYGEGVKRVNTSPGRRDVRRYGIMFDGQPVLEDVCRYVSPDLEHVANWRIVCDVPSYVAYHDDQPQAIDDTNFEAILDELGIQIGDLRNADDGDTGDDIACFAEIYLDEMYGRTKVLLIAPGGNVHCLASGHMGLQEQVGVAFDLLTDEQADECGLYSGTSQDDWEGYLIETSEWIETNTDMHWHDGELWDCSQACYADDDLDAKNDRILRAQELADKLADYPILDDDAYGKREFEAWEKYVDVAIVDEGSNAQGRLSKFQDSVGLSDAAFDERYDLLDRLCVGEVANAVRNQMNHTNGFTGEYDPPFLNAVLKLLESDDSWSQTDKADLLLMFKEIDVYAGEVIGLLKLIGTEDPRGGDPQVWE